MKKTFLNTLTTEEIIKRLKNGEVVKREDRSGLIYRMIDGVIIQEDGEDIVIGGCFTVDGVDDYYFEEEEPFIITETGFYRTRDGRKVYVSYIDKDIVGSENVFGIIDGEGDSSSWFKYGRYDTNRESENDIVAKWED